MDRNRSQAEAIPADLAGAASAPHVSQTTVSQSARARPSVSFILLMIAITAAGAGAVAWAFARPDPRTVEVIIPTPAPLVVHVTGAVSNPGVYTLPPGSRVSDAVDAAGGLSEASGINLALALRDGQQVDVPPAANHVAADGAASTGATPVTGLPDVLLDLNTASAVQLQQLPGIGPARAASIISFRERNGPILFVDDLTAVDGIGQATVDGLRLLVIQP